MTTIIRVKRHRGEDPVDALVLSCKRKKTENSDSSHDLFEKVLNFSGTVENKDDKVAKKTVQSFNKETKYSNFKKNHTPEIRSKQRQERRERSEDNRFMLLSCLRSGNGAENSEVDELAEKENFTIVDVTKESNQDLTEHDVTDGFYVYDLYSIQENDSYFNDIYMENLLSSNQASKFSIHVQVLGNELEYRNGEDCYEEVDPDEDDSNDESNWRNDYPDTYSSIDEDEDDDLLARHLKVCHLDADNSNLSSDSGEEEYLNYDDKERYHYYEAEDIGGKRYAEYKANAMKVLNGIYKDSDESEDDFPDD